MIANLLKKFQLSHILTSLCSMSHNAVVLIDQEILTLTTSSGHLMMVVMAQTTAILDSK